MPYYIGYELLWSKYPAMEFLDGDPLKVEMIDNSPEPGLQITPGVGAQQSGRPLAPDHIPTVLRWKSRQPMPDFEGPDGFLCISRRFREIVEELEPGVHQFFPLRVVDRDDAPLAKRWIFVVCNRIDSVDREHTNWKLWRGLRWDAEGVANPTLVFNAKQIGNRHFWRDRHLLPSASLLASDAAGNKLQASSLTALKLSHRETIG